MITLMPGKSYSGKLTPLSKNDMSLYEELKRHVIFISDSIGIRNIGNYQNLLKTEEYIKNELAKTGIQVSSHSFTVHGKKVSNLEIIIPGQSDENLIIGAHYDSYGQSLAANDNATGMSALIEISKMLCNKKFKKTLRFIAFVNEEPPYFKTDNMGSFVYAKALKNNKIQVYGMFSLETIGCYLNEENSQKYPFLFNLFYPHKGNFIAFVGNLSSRSLITKTIKIFRNNTKFPSEGTMNPMGP